MEKEIILGKLTDALDAYVDFCGSKGITIDDLLKEDPTDEAIRKLNPWKGVADKLTPNYLQEGWEEQLVCDCDKNAVEGYNSKYGENNVHHLQVHTMPYPFVGDVLHKKLVFLSLNPGYIKLYNNDAPKAFSKEALQRLIVADRKEMLMQSERIYTTIEQQIVGTTYWNRNLRELNKTLRPDLNDAELMSIDTTIFSKVSIIQYLGYPSELWADIPKGGKGQEIIFGSQLFTKLLIWYLAYKKDTKFFILRSPKKWEDFLGVKPQLDTTFWTKEQPTRSQSFTQKNIGDAFNKVINLLKAKANTD